MIEELRRRANTYLRMFRLTRREAHELLDEIDALQAENARVHDYACRMDALAEERLIVITELQSDLDNVDGLG